MPTLDRPDFVSSAISYFLKQDYLNKELIIFDNGDKSILELIPDHKDIRYYYDQKSYLLGTCRNICCEQAKGDIIIHWDDDDWYADDWITQQVNALIGSSADITGLNNVNFRISESNEKWKFRDKLEKKPWVYGATLAYWKSYWLMNPFSELNTGEDNDFVYNSTGKIFAHDYSDGYLGFLHQDNVGTRVFENPREKLQLSKWMRIIEKPLIAQNNGINKLNTNDPKITCIMPTANRPNFISLSIENFLKQDYNNKELVIIDDGTNPIDYLIPNDSRIKYFYFEPKHTIGTKRNWACEKASGEIITHWDDDDWYADDWLSHQVNALINSKADISGINQVQFYSPSLNKYWMTKNSNSQRPWLTGQSLTYKKSFWEKHGFKDLQTGEDDDFVRNNNAKVFAHDYFQGFLATLHSNNTSMKFFEDPSTKSTV